MRGTILLALLWRTFLAPSHHRRSFQLRVSTIVWFSSCLRYILIICLGSLGLICWTRLCWLVLVVDWAFLVLVLIFCCLVFGIVWCWFFDWWTAVGFADWLEYIGVEFVSLQSSIFIYLVLVCSQDLLLWSPKIVFNPLTISYLQTCYQLLPFILMEVFMLSGPRQLKSFFLVERSLITWLVNPLYL